MEIRKTRMFEAWFLQLKDRRAKARIQARIDRLAVGHFGDVAPAGEGVSEMRIFVGAGYRVYFIQLEKNLVILLAGGNKGTQKIDIATAKKLARQLR